MGSIKTSPIMVNIVAKVTDKKTTFPRTFPAFSNCFSPSFNEIVAVAPRATRRLKAMIILLTGKVTPIPAMA